MAAPVVNPPTPYTTLIPGGFFPGKMIRIQGVVPMHAQRFDVNLQTGGGGEIACEDVAVHASVRLTEGYIARNSFQGGCWQEEMGDGGLPIQLGQRFEMLLLCETYEYKIAINGQHFCGFPSRVPYNRITHLMIEGDVQLELIAWEGAGAASAPPMNGPPQYGAPVPPPQYTPQQTYVQQGVPQPPPGAVNIPMPGSNLPLSALSYGSDSRLYPNLEPHKITVENPHSFGGQPHPVGIIHPNEPMPMPQPTMPHLPADPHRPFPKIEMPQPTNCNYPAVIPNFPPSKLEVHLSEKALKKIAKAEYKANKKMHKEHMKAEKKVAKAEWKAAKAERKAMKKHGIPTAALVGTGIGVAGAATFAYGVSQSGRRSSTSSTSSSTSSSSSD